MLHTTSAYWPRSFVAGSDRIFLVADDPIEGEALWQSDGSPAGTIIAADPLPGPAPGTTTWPLGLIGTSLMFAADDGVHGIEPRLLPLTTPIGPPVPPVVLPSSGPGGP